MDRPGVQSKWEGLGRWVPWADHYSGRHPMRKGIHPSSNNHNQGVQSALGSNKRLAFSLRSNLVGTIHRGKVHLDESRRPLKSKGNRVIWSTSLSLSKTFEVNLCQGGFPLLMIRALPYDNRRLGCNRTPLVGANRMKSFSCWRLSLLMLMVLVASLAPRTEGMQPPKAGMAAPPVSAKDSGAGFDPIWVSHRGQVLLVLYVGANSDVPIETIQRINDWQDRLGPQGLQVVVITEGSLPPSGLHPEVIVAADQNGKTRSDYQITEDREYFLVDRYGRLRRQKINEQSVQKALNERFDPTWVGYSGAWNRRLLCPSWRDPFLSGGYATRHHQGRRGFRCALNRAPDLFGSTPGR